MLGLPKTTRPLNVPEPADTSLRATGDVFIVGVPYPFHSTNWAQMFREPAYLMVLDSTRPGLVTDTTTD